MKMKPSATRFDKNERKTDNELLPCKRLAARNGKVPEISV
jgi:hypothetical protein